MNQQRLPVLVLLLADPAVPTSDLGIGLGRLLGIPALNFSFAFQTEFAFLAIQQNFGGRLIALALRSVSCSQMSEKRLIVWMLLVADAALDFPVSQVGHGVGRVVVVDHVLQEQRVRAERGSARVAVESLQKC